ncbi:MAG: hypothetical protein EU548_10520 [Promethearchaeota archaeon]|nr:MAG: hypothetical protein EU548_10520 [Candidatus Lokiarchaeota archaeon]
MIIDKIACMILIMMNPKKYSLGILYGTDDDTIMLAQKFVGNLVNDDEFCKACELLEQNVKCDKCRESLINFSGKIYFYEQIGKGAPELIENTEEYFPKQLPDIDFLMIIGIHQDLLADLPHYLQEKEIKAVIVPVEDPKWVPPGLQVQVLEEFEKFGIQAAFPKPFCSLSKELNDYNKIGFNVTKERSHIIEFIEYYKIGEPIVYFSLSEDGSYIEDACVIQSAPCGSTYFIVQQLKAKYIAKREISLNERISKAHHSYPCNASMDQDPILRESILHVGGYLVRNEIRKKLNLPIEKERKLMYVIT